MIKNILGMEIDFSKVERVGEVYGDPMWRRYNVYFISGRVVEIFEERHRESFPRDEFIKIWKKSSQRNRRK